MMKTIEIKNRFSDDVIICGKYESIKNCLEKNCNANLRGANLGGANLYNADLRGANLCGANLCDSNLCGADLYGANLRGADLYNANLRDSDLGGANLCGANLRDSNLYNANLRDSDLRGAEYRDSIITTTPIQIFGDKYDILIIGDYIKIGCEEHKISEWFKFGDKRILEMDGKGGLVWWKKRKPILQSICSLPKEVNDENNNT